MKFFQPNMFLIGDTAIARGAAATFIHLAEAVTCGKKLLEGHQSVSYAHRGTSTIHRKGV